MSQTAATGRVVETEAFGDIARRREEAELVGRGGRVHTPNHEEGV
jgi:hypothetical protein